MQVCTEWNRTRHVGDYEGDPRRRPFTAEELQAFFDHADGEVDRIGRRDARVRWLRSAMLRC